MLVRCTVTLPPSSPVHYAGRPGRTGAVFIEEFGEPRRRIRPSLGFPALGENAAKSAISAIFGAETGSAASTRTPIAMGNDRRSPAQSFHHPLNRVGVSSV